MKRVLLALGLSVGLAGVSQAMTSAEIISRARVYLKDQATSSTRQQFTDATLMTYISDGQREANSFAWLIQQRSTFTLTAGTTEYSLPTTFMATLRVMYRKGGTNPWIKLEQTSFSQLDADNGGWMTLSGTPYKYYVYLATTPVIGFMPAPVSTSTGTVQVDYIADTNDITATSDVPFNGYLILKPYHTALIYYVTCRGYITIEEYDMAQPFCEQWNSYIGTMKSGILKQPDFNPGFGGRRN